MPDVNRFVARASAILDKVPPRSELVIDVRGNPGGLIAAAHGLLQLLSSGRVEPAALEFIATPRTLALTEWLAATEDPVSRAEMARAADSIRYALATGQGFSEPIPFEDKSLWDNVTQRYEGSIVLIVDPLSYSATEIFAAGFQDLGLGKVLGTGPMTGGGGGSPWSYERLRQCLELPQLQAKGRPEVPSFEVTVRRVVRMNGSTRMLIEGTGVAPHAEYTLTEADVLSTGRDSNPGLIQAALDLLRAPVPA